MSQGQLLFDGRNTGIAIVSWSRTSLPQAPMTTPRRSSWHVLFTRGVPVTHPNDHVGSQAPGTDGNRVAGRNESRTNAEMERPASFRRALSCGQQRSSVYVLDRAAGRVAWPRPLARDRRTAAIAELMGLGGNAGPDAACPPAAEPVRGHHACGSHDHRRGGRRSGRAVLVIRATPPGYVVRSRGCTRCAGHGDNSGVYGGRRRPGSRAEVKPLPGRPAGRGGGLYRCRVSGDVAPCGKI